MDDRRLTPASLREAGRSILDRSGKLLFGLGMTATLTESASGARKDKHADDETDAKKEERRESRTDERKRDNQNQSQGNAKAESSDNAASRPNDENQQNGDRSEKRDRREERTEEDDNSVSGESTDGERRTLARKQEADTASDDGGGNRGERRVVEQAQRDDEPDLGDTTDDILPTPTVPSNPTIPVSSVTDPTNADLFIEANPDVVASVSTNGGFAFARSGNVIAVSGPDGAQIIQSDDPDDVVTPSPSPDVPSDDGGNNDLDFTS